MKNKRRRKKTVFIAAEGQREKGFLCFLQSLFDPNKSITIKFHPDFGGTSNAILDRAIKSPHERVYAWFDEDDKLDNEHRNVLQKKWGVLLPSSLKDNELQAKNINNKKPIVIISHPYSVEALIIQLFDKKFPKLKEPCTNSKDFEENKKRMKSSVNGFFGSLSDEEYFAKYLTQDIILKKAKVINELKLLLSIFNVDNDEK